MKRIALLLSLLVLLAGQDLLGQGVPQGMKYQGVARDANGHVLVNQRIALKINLNGENTPKLINYSEVHEVLTNSLGLFTLTVGAGRVESGTFQQIPWATDNIWMEVAMRDDDGFFSTISHNKLLAVPYAFHAGSADNLVMDQLMKRSADCHATGLPFWTTIGNNNVDTICHFIGTRNFVDVLFKTDGIERMRIRANGDIDIANNLKLGGNLTVEQSVFLNTIGGETINNGPFTVTKQSPTLLSGTLTVDLATDLNASLNVDGPTNLNSLLNVNNASPTLLTGTLLVNEDATFNQHVLLDNADLNSFTPTEGALVVNGGIGIGKNLNVGGDATFNGNTSFAGPVIITDETPSVDTESGALVVAGGAGIRGDVNIGGKVNVAKTFNLSTAEVVDPEANATQVGTGHVAKFRNTGNGSGIIIQVGASTPHNNNNFITFVNSSGNTVGRIEGEDGPEDLANNAGHKLERDFLITDIALSATAEAIAIAEEIQAGVALAAAASSSTACGGLGACVTAPIPSLITSETANLVVATANLALQTADLAKVSANLILFDDNVEAEFGVTFASGAEDYAEYLPKQDPKESFMPGELVGLKNGFITKQTEGADQIMVISHNPAMLGGIPKEGTEDQYEMVAFMGQIPTRIIGEVEAGDYILPSGYANGLGIGKSKTEMKPADYKKVLGVAWETSKGKPLSVVNVAIGLNTNDLAEVVDQQEQQLKAQEEEISQLKAQLNQTHTILAELVPGFSEAVGMETDDQTTPALVVDNQQAATAQEEVQVVHPSGDDIIYYELTDEDIEAGFQLAEDIFKQTAMDINDHPFWNRIYNEAGYKEQVKAEIREKFTHAIHTHRHLNEHSQH